MAGMANLGALYLQLKLKDEATKELDKAKSKIQDTGKAIEDVGKKFNTFVTLPLIGLGSLALKEFEGFESSMKKVQATTQASGKDMAILSEKARDLGKNTQFSAGEVADAMNYMGMAGWNTDQILSGVDATLQLAAASGADLATTSDIVTDALTAFGMKAEDTQGFVDLLANTSRNANTDVEMLGESFKYVAPVAGSLGISAEDTAMALGLMGNAGIKAGQAGTSLRGIINSLVKPTGEAAKLMKDYNIELVKNNDGSIDLEKTFGNMKKSLSGLSKEQQAQIISTIVGTESMSGLMAILNASEQDTQKLKKATEDYTGSAKEMADTMNSGVKGKINNLKSSFSELLIVIGENLVPIFTKLIDKLTDIIDWFGNLDEGTQEAIVKMGLFAAAIGPVLSIAGKLTTVAGGLSKILGTAGLAGAATTAAGAVGTTAAGGAAVGLGGALSGIATFLTGPWGIAIGAAVGGLTLFKKYCDDTAVVSFDQTVDQINGLSDATKDLVKNVHDDKQAFDELFKSFNDYAANGVADGVTEGQKQTLIDIEKNVYDHAQKLYGIIDTNKQEERALYKTYAELATGDDKAFWEGKLNDLDTNAASEQERVQNIYSSITNTMLGALSERRELTEEEEANIAAWKEELGKKEIEMQVANQDELTALEVAGNDLRLSATAENFQAVITKANELRDARIQTVDEAFQKEKETIAQSTTLTQEEKDEALRIASERHTGLLTEAEKEKNSLIAEYMKTYPELTNIVDTETGEMYGSFKQTMNGLGDENKKVLVRMMKDTGYTTAEAHKALAGGYDGTAESVEGSIAAMERQMQILQEESTKTGTDCSKDIEEYETAIEKLKNEGSSSIGDFADTYKTNLENTKTSTGEGIQKVDDFISKLDKIPATKTTDINVNINETTHKKTKVYGEQKVPTRTFRDVENFDINTFALTGFNPEGILNKDREILQQVNNNNDSLFRNIEDKLTDLIKVSSAARETKLYIDKREFVGTISDEISEELGRKARWNI